LIGGWPLSNFFEFVNQDEYFGEPMRGHYDFFLVGFSVLIAWLGAYGAFAFSERIRATGPIRYKAVWLVLGAIALGGSVWAMHFSGMLAFKLPFTVDYDVYVTLISMAPAVLAAGLMLFIVSESDPARWRIWAGGALVAIGIAVMHYTGMAAMRANLVMVYDPVLFAMSIALAIVLAIAALVAWSRANADTFNASIVGTMALDWKKIAAATYMALAVSAMHYTAIEATYFFPAPDAVAAVAGLRSDNLVYLVLPTTAAIIVALYAATLIGKQLETGAEVAKARSALMDAIETISDGFVIFDDDGRLSTTNSVFREMNKGMGDALLPGTPYERFLRAWAGLQDALPDDVSAEDFVQFQMRKLSCYGASDEERNNKGRWLHVKERKRGGGGIVAVWSDITPFKEVQATLKNLAHHDQLTGLPNRLLFEDRLERAIALAKRLNGETAFLYLDLDGFKKINDNLGHGVGDLILEEVARRLKSNLRETDTAARLGGDEFVAVLAPPVTRQSAEIAAYRILHSISEPIRLADDICSVGVSIGISIYPSDADNAGTLNRHADAAMYAVKANGRGGILFHDSLKRSGAT